jgi:hypothetical protein
MQSEQICVEMVKKFLLSILLLILAGGKIFSQAKPVFSGENIKFREELTVFMGPNLNSDQLQIMNSFLTRWDSSGFSQDNMVKIIDLSNQLAKRSMRPSPHFTDYLKTLTNFCTTKKSPDFFKSFLASMAQMAIKLEISNDVIDRFLKNISSLIIDNVIYDSGSARWKVKNENFRFSYDSVFKVTLTNVTLTCFTQRDSTEIYKVNGVYYPEKLYFQGTTGMVTWEKAGYNKEDVFAEFNNYRINITKNNFTIDSARLIHKTYFRNPVYGLLTDQAYPIPNKERAVYPRFETYTKKFFIENMYKGVNYEGGLTLEGASVKGTGENYLPAKITLYRNDTLFVKVSSKNFQLNKSGINSLETSATLFLDKDSIFHTSLSFSYNTETRQVNLFRSNNPVAKSPYYDSFHGLDLYFEYMSWNMNDSKIVMSRARGASMGQAKFESVSFFNERYFQKLMGIDDYHPLYRLKQFAAYFYSETFPVTEFAKWLKKPEESVIGLCIDLANQGFLFYDRVNNEVTIKKKTDDFIAANSGKKDYDVISIFSETNAPKDNAILDLKNFRLTVNGVQGVFLSDSQKVAIFPYNNQLVIGKNKSISFDGVVEAGLFTIFGHNFTFSYDTFKIRLQKIDSIKIEVETDKKDFYGNPITSRINSMIQLTTAELYIDDPNNKSGSRSLQQYPIINAITYSYIFYDKIPGLEGRYKQGDFYFKVDPFTYENIDHYKNDDMKLAGMFYAGNIIKPTRQFLSIQADNSLGFSSVLSEEGLNLYSGKGTLYDNLSLSNKGLIGSGTLKRLTSATEAEEYKFFPDSMITEAKSFDITEDAGGKFPDLRSTDVSVKWLPEKDVWLASNTKEKRFEMFRNGTLLDGKLNLTPGGLQGQGIIDMLNSRITSKGFRFASNTIQADTSDYNLKSLQGDGYAFIAENANTSIDFKLQQSRFSLNTDSSVVKFPEIEYICTMTNFIYNMQDRILNMEQRGKSSTTLMPAEQLLKLDYQKLEKPTFFSTNKQTDTITFSSWKGRYHLNEEYIEAENINYLKIADALIQPENGKIIINKRAIIKPLQNSFIAINNKHLLHSGIIEIENSQRYSGSGKYNYVDDNKEIQQIDFPTITVDLATTSAKGFISSTQNFKLSSAFTFMGDVNLSALDDFLTFTGAAGIVHNCDKINSYSIKFKAPIDPKAVMIPVTDKARDINDNLVFSGSYIDIDSTHMYPAFLSARKTWSDVALVTADGYLYFAKDKGQYKIAQKEKLADQTLPGSLLTFDKNYCILSGEGKMNFGANYDLLKMTSAGKVIHDTDSGKINIEAIIALDFYFSVPALKIMSDEIKMIPTLKAVNLNSDLNNKGMKDLLGVQAATQIKEEMDLFGSSKNLPKEFTSELLLNDVKLYWNEATSSFRSKGKIGIGFIGAQPINVYVDGLIEIQRRRSGDMLDVYLKADESTWYYFSYFRGVLMTHSGNNNYNTIITSTKLNDRKHPESSVRIPYTYMISVENRLERFIRRMESDIIEEQPANR